jgi:hypothetical protein
MVSGVWKFSAAHISPLRAGSEIQSKTDSGKVSAIVKNRVVLT